MFFSYLRGVKKQLNSPSKKGQVPGELITITKEEYDTLQTEVVYLKHELAQIKRMIFGCKSERFVSQDPNQLTLEMEEPAPLVLPTKKPKEATQNINPSEKQGHPRLPIPEHLPRVEEIIEPSQDLTGATKIGEVITEVLEYIPGKLIVRRIVRPKYSLPNQEGVVIADMPTLPLPRSNAGAGLLAHILICKFVDHLPFYRIVKQFKREGFQVAESTVNDWFSATCNLLDPLYEKLKEKVQQSSYLMADETPLPVLTSQKKNATHKGYHWVYFSPLEKLICFDYRKSRGREGPQEFLQPFSGFLQTDGYTAYDDFDNHKDITLMACMAHARRKFEQARDNDPERAEYVLSQMQLLYQIERTAREQQLSFERRKALRQKEAVPVLSALEKWFKEQLVEVLPKSAMGKAIAYTLKLWSRLVRYVDNGFLEIDNNWVENSIRPVTLGRKNYLFAGSHEGAQRAAMIYSFVETCKKNGIEPMAWLKDVLKRLPDHKANKLEELLPQNWKK